MIDFLKKLFVINPKKRLTVEEALNHEYLKEFRNEKEKLTVAKKISFDYSHKFQLEVALYKEKIMFDMIDGKYNSKNI